MNCNRSNEICDARKRLQCIRRDVTAILFLVKLGLEDDHDVLAYERMGVEAVNLVEVIRALRAEI